MFGGFAAVVALAACGSSTGGDLDGGGGSLNLAGSGGDQGTGNAAGSSSTGAMPDLGGSSAVGGTSSGGTSSAGTGSNMGGGGNTGPVTMVTPIDEKMACTSSSATAELTQLDLFIMLDKSQSMSDATSAGPSKWTVISAAIDDFVKDPASAGIGAGIQFFGLLDAQNNKICTEADYAKPAVGIAPLNGNAGKISGAIAAIKNLGGGTPTTQALTGAIDYAQIWSKAHSTHKTIVVFATDGLPNGCNSSVDTATKAAAAGLKGPPSIQTYVIGVFGTQDKAMSVPNLNSFAKAGGTGSAFVVDTTGDAGQQFLDAMNAIREANRVECKVPVPIPAKNQSIDFSRVGVDYTPSSGPSQSLAWATDAKACGKNGGWFYDNNAAPSTISLCPTSCTTVQADPAAKLDIYLACGTGTSTGSGGNGAGGNGAGGTGAGGTGAGGMSSGGTGNPMCLLTGQSCATDGECCSSICGTSGVCQSKVK
jgi:hypothetical protein